ncbi:MAG TPA: hypothetical protein VK965_02160, partial [Halomonas sp.]|nr:hypothetical protein [Halomonas sp.]
FEGNTVVKIIGVGIHGGTSKVDSAWWRVEQISCLYKKCRTIMVLLKHDIITLWRLTDVELAIKMMRYIILVQDGVGGKPPPAPPYPCLHPRNTGVTHELSG